MKFLILIVFFLLATSCVSTPPKEVINQPNNLLKFAQANCLFWYFNEKGYDTTDIRKIAGGFTELGSSDPEAYQEIALYLSEHSGLTNSKQDIDPKLNLCLNLEKDPKLLDLTK